MKYITRTAARSASTPYPHQEQRTYGRALWPKAQLIALALATTTSLSAQETSDAVYELDPVVVTGDLWESELQKTTASVSVLDEARLKSNGTQHFEDVIHAIPNLTWTGGTSRPRFLQIRGIGENSQFEGETPDSTVRFLVDDLDFTGLGTVGNLFDVQQVEVLRGPQAGAFGANAAGGVVKLLTNDPSPYWTGQVESSAGEDSLFSTGVAVGGPLLENDPEKLTFRFSAHQLQQDGFRDNQFLNKDDTNERDELNTRLKIRWITNEDLQWDGTLFYADADNGYDEWSMGNTKFKTFSDEPGRDEQESFATSLRGTSTAIDNIQVSSITSFSKTDSKYSYDNDWTPASYQGFIVNDRERDTFSQEVRFDSSDQSDALGIIDRWTFGLYYQTMTEDAFTQYDQPGFVAQATYKYETDNYSAYGQIAHDFSETTRLILGFRYEHHKVNFDTLSATNTPTNADSAKKSDLWGGKITMEHDLSESQMAFASVTRGYKSAGANNGIFRNGTDPLTYDVETLYNFETGLRSQWLDSKVSTQVTAFYLYREDPQLRDSNGSGGFFRYFTSNGDEAKHFGLEAEATWFISSNWTAIAGLGLIETEDDLNDELANAPSYTFNTQLKYQADNGFFAMVEARGSDEYYESNNKNNRDQRVRESFVTFNGSVGYNYENWTLTVWGRNLFDREYQKRVFFFDNGAGDQRYENPANPQQFGVTANYSW